MEKFNQVTFTGTIQDLLDLGFTKNTHSTDALSYWARDGIIVWAPDMIITSPHIHSMLVFLTTHRLTVGAIPKYTIDLLNVLYDSNLIMIT